MSDRPRPAWAHDSIALRLSGPAESQDLTPEWVFGGSTGSGVRVAVIDSGIDADHPMLGDCVDQESAIDFSVDGDGAVVSTVGPHGDQFGHGTAVAGIIHTLAPEARITSVRVLGPNLSGKAASFHAGLSWAVDEGFDVVNLSLGTTRSEWALAFHEVCDRAYFGNTFVVTAANNVQRASYPSLFASVASVACNTSTDPLRFHANPQPPTEFLARGIEIEVPWIDGGMTTITGNSFAAPHIAAFAALVKSKHPDLRPFQIKAALWATSANVRESSAIEPAGRRTTVFFAGNRPGTQVDADSVSAPDGYRLLDLGRQTRWGTTWRATRTDDGAEVQIHQLDPAERDPASAATELRAAMSRVGSIEHPGLAQVFEVVDRPWLGTVSERRRSSIESPRPTPPDRVVDIGLGIAVPLQAAHAAGIAHGDLAAGTVSVDDRGVVIHDLGLAEALGTPSPTSTAALDPTYLGHVAPEILAGKPPTPLGDVYALGELLHRLLTGHPPYSQDVPIGRYLRNRLTTDAPSAAAGGTTVPPALVDLIDRCLAREPSHRPPSMAEVADRLGTLAAGQLEQTDFGNPDDRPDPGGQDDVTEEPPCRRRLGRRR